MARTEGPNVLLIVLDCVRARNTDLLGRDRGTTPRMRCLADGAFTNYTNARVAAPWSLPSHVSIFTSTSPVVHEVTSLSDRLRPDSTVFTWLSDRGYETGVFTENPYLNTAEFGVDQEFDYVDPFVNVIFPEALTPHAYAGLDGNDTWAFLTDAVSSGRPIRSLLNGAFPYFMSTRVGAVLDRRRNEGLSHAKSFLNWSAGTAPWAACLNFVDAHAPYVPTPRHNRFARDEFVKRSPYVHPDPDSPGEVLNNAERLYDGCVHQVDHVVGFLVDALEERGDLDDTLVVVTADHGEAFGEPHGITGEPMVGHNGGFDEVHAHVPLLVKPPGQVEGEQVSGLSTPVAFAEVVRDLVASGDGRGDATFAIEQLVGQYGYGSNTSDGPTGEAVLVGYEQRDGRIYKYVRDRAEERVYRVDERGLLVDDEPHRLDDLLINLQGESLRRDRDGRLTDDTRSRLSNLGYLDTDM